jgi:Na+-driven multidrug efflux pump
LGLTFGLKNHFAEALAVNDQEKAGKLVSTTYIVLSVVFAVVMSLSLLVFPFVNVEKLFNIKLDSSDLYILMIITFFSFCIRMILQVIFAVLEADQRPAEVSFVNMLSSVLSLISVFIITRLKSYGDLLLTGSIINIVPLIVMSLYTVILFSGRYKNYRPSLKKLDFSYSKGLFNLGGKFFIIQIADMILFSTTNFIIIQYFSAKDVTIYNIGYRYFSIISMLFGIIIAPLWSATTEAFIKEDFVWIRNTFRKIRFIGLVFVFCAFCMLMVSEPVIRIWVGEKVLIPFSLKLVFFVNVSTGVLFTPYVAFLNGVSKIKLNLYLTVLNTCTFFPYILLFIKGIGLGVAGVVLGSFFAELPCRISQPIQYYKLVNKTAKGIWNA